MTSGDGVGEEDEDGEEPDPDPDPDPEPLPAVAVGLVGLVETTSPIVPGLVPLAGVPPTAPLPPGRLTDAWAERAL